MYKLIAFLTVVLIVSGCGSATQTNNTTTSTSGNNTSSNSNKSTDAFTYNDGGLGITVTKNEKPIAQFLPNPVLLATRSSECGTNHNAAYFQTLLSAFTPDQKAEQYTFTYKSANRTFTVIPNVLKYRNMIDFKEDFGVCNPSGDYPAQVSAKSLLFATPCPGADETSDCEVMLKTIDPTIKLK